MAQQTNWLDSWHPYDFQGLRKSELDKKKDGIKAKVRTKLNASDNETGEQHSIAFIWRKLTAPGSYRLVAHLTPREKRNGNGSGDSVISPTVPHQP
jgi:hypothetical protein